MADSPSDRREFRVADFVGVRAVFFDLDDTLCGYWDASKVALRKAFAEHGPPGIPVEQMVRHWAKAFRAFGSSLKQSPWYEEYLRRGGSSRTEQMRRTLAEAGFVDEEMAQRLSDAYGRERDAALQLFRDALETLEALSRAYPLGLITNGPADIQRQEIATLGIERFFGPIFIEGELGFGKPDPEVFRRAEQAVRCSPGELLFVGNSYRHDIRPSIEAGWRTVWVRRPSDVPPSIDGQDAKPETLQPNDPAPTAIVDDLASLIPLAGLQPGQSSGPRRPGAFPASNATSRKPG